MRYATMKDVEKNYRKFLFTLILTLIGILIIIILSILN